MTQCLVIILAMLLTTGPVEIIGPVKETNDQAETLKLASVIRSMVLIIYVILLSTIFKVPNKEFQVIPNQSKTWVGSHTDFSSLTTEPAAYKSRLTACAVAR